MGLPFAVLALASLLATSSPGALAQGLFSWFTGPPPPPPPPGAGRTVSEVICTDPELGTLCRAARAAARDPVVAELEDVTFTGTIFAPTDEAFQNDGDKLAEALGIASIEVLPTEPTVAAEVIGAHVIVGQAIQFAQLQNGQTYRSATGENLKISTGYLYGIYVNDARLRETEGANNIPAARALIHKTTGVIVPAA